ncbi:TIGR04104 family putative zinc finger protein [Jeotgalibacillus salarius]|nr:TIGR04104 family putative zinc finger protein [Jeotgalibacillus salarius]
MPVCQNCNYKWTYSETLKRSVFIGPNGAKCPDCNEKQYPTTRSRQKWGVLAGLIPVLMIIITGMILDFAWPVALFIALVAAILVITLLPFTFDLSNENEPLW